MLSDQFSKEDLEKIKYNVFYEKIPGGDARLQRYLSLKSRQSEYRSWIKDEASIARIIRMYETGRLIPVRGDLKGKHSLKSIALQFEEEHLPIDVIYFSNALGNHLPAVPDELGENMRHIRVHDDTIIICTGSEDYSPSSSMEMPAYANHSLNKIFFHRWIMEVRTVNDHIRRGPLDDRTRRIASENVRPEEVGLRIPKPGLIVSSDIPESLVTNRE